MFDQIAKQENKLKKHLVEVFNKSIDLVGYSYFVQQHQDVRKQGIPDLSVSGLGKTTWLELKHATPASGRKTPTFSTRENQEDTCRELERTSSCFYVVYYIRDPETILTKIVSPSEVFGKKGKIEEMYTIREWQNYDHEAIVKFIHEKHHESTGSIVP